jgi:hypothetical protein
VAYVEVVNPIISSGGSRISSSFVDPLDNSFGANTGPLNLASVNNFNWFYSILGWDTPFLTPVEFMNAFSFGQALSGGGGTGMTSGLSQMGANPPYMVPCGIIPIRLMPGLPSNVASSYYSAKQKFVQLTFNALGANNSAGFGLINFEDKTGTGVGGASNICHDAYIIRMDGFFIRYNSGAANSVLNNIGAGNFVQGDVWRLSMDATNAAQTVCVLTRNGTTFATITDNNINRLTGPAMPVIAGIASSAALGAWQFEVKNFSCGLGT